MGKVERATVKKAGMVDSELVEAFDTLSGDIKDVVTPEKLEMLENELKRRGLAKEVKILGDVKWAWWHQAERFADLWEAVKTKLKVDPEED